MSDVLSLDDLPNKPNLPEIRRFILEVKIYPNGSVFTSTRPMPQEAKYHRAAAKANKNKEIEKDIKTTEEVEYL